MGRYCYFSNGVEYKFWFAVQDSGFGNIQGVDENARDNYNISYDNEGEHPFCSCNCDKEPINPLNMLRDGENLFCDEDCKQRFTGGESNDPLDIHRLCKLYELLQFCKNSGYDVSDCTIDSEELDGELLEDWEENGLIQVSDSKTFELKVYEEELLTFITNTGFPLPRWEDYSKDTDGTDKLMTALYEFPDDKIDNESKYADYLLACVIYHMNLYDDDIRGRYEV